MSPLEARVVMEEAFPAGEYLWMVLLGPAGSLRQPAGRFGAVTEWKLKRPEFAPPRR